MISTTSSPGVRTISIFCAVSPSSILAFPASAGCAAWSTAIDPMLFGRCFHGWIADAVAGRTTSSPSTAERHAPTTVAKGRRPCIRSAPTPPTPVVTLAVSVPEKTNEITAIPDLLDELTATKQLEGALVTIDAMGCQVEIAEMIVAHKADYLLALRQSPADPQRRRGLFPHRSGRRARHHNGRRKRPWPYRDPHLHRLEGHRLDRLRAQLSGQPRFTAIKTIVKVRTGTEHADC